MGAAIFLVFLLAAIFAGVISTHVPTRLEPAPAPEAAERRELPRHRRVRPGRLQPGRLREPRLAPRRRRHHAAHVARRDAGRARRGLLPPARPGRHALHGRAHGLPRDHPGHRVHGRAGPRRVERDPRPVARLHAADGAAGPEHRAEPPGARLRRGRAGARPPRLRGGRSGTSCRTASRRSWSRARSSSRTPSWPRPSWASWASACRRTSPRGATSSRAGRTSSARRSGSASSPASP